MHRIVDQRDEALAALAHLAQREAEQDRDDEYRQEIALRDRADEVRRDHLHQEVDDGERFRARYIAGDRLLTSSEAGAIWSPAPGCHKLPTISPTTRAIVETTSK